MNVTQIKPKILIVDDTPENIFTLKTLLKKLDVETISATSGNEALSLTLEHEFGLAIIDIQMPDMNGYELVELMRGNPKTKSLPVIFISAIYSDNYHHLKGYDTGAVDFLSKPFIPEILLSKVRVFLDLYLQRVKLQELVAQLNVKNEALGNEINQRQRAEEQLRYDALHDALTGLPNRTLFMNRLIHVLARAKQDKSHLFAVLFLDLDRFKLVNDSMGHLVGDQLLLIVARRLKNCVRSGDTVARLGGDEFAILLDNIQDIQAAIRVAKDILTRLALPVKLDGHKIFTGTSIGIVLSAAHYEQAVDILRDADMAMYRAKNQGKGRYALFDNKMHTQVMGLLALETELRQAVEYQEFVVYYQPIVSLTSGEITGVEALLRWQHPQRGLLTPQAFIAQTKETGLIVPIGEWLLRTACRQIQVWHTSGYVPLRVAVNMSARQLRQQNVLALIKDTLAETGLPAHALELEITEGIMTQNIDFMVLEELRDMGIKISIDDFGIGSSLEGLKQFPLNTLKIDQSFVRGMTTEAGDRAIITAMINMAHGLNLRVIAEGVETEDQLAFLQGQACDEIQGYLFSRPVPAKVLTELLQEKDSRRLNLQVLNKTSELSIQAQATRNIGYALLNEQLIILTSNESFNCWGQGVYSELVQEELINLAGRFLPELFPELLGLEDTLSQLARSTALRQAQDDASGLAHKQGQTFTIPQIHRPADDSFGCYFDLQVEPFFAAESTLLVMVTDVTEQARLEFELRHERNQLRLDLIQRKRTEELRQKSNGDE